MSGFFFPDKVMPFGHVAGFSLSYDENTCDRK